MVMTNHKVLRPVSQTASTTGVCSLSADDRRSGAIIQVIAMIILQPVAWLSAKGQTVFLMIRLMIFSSYILFA